MQPIEQTGNLTSVQKKGGTNDVLSVPGGQ